MEILHKTIRREPWERVIKRTQNFFFSDDGGAVSLLRFDKLTSPIIRDYGDGLSGTVLCVKGAVGASRLRDCFLQPVSATPARALRTLANFCVRGTCKTAKKHGIIFP